ncbi:hypothetical protein I6E29_08160 [Arcanobacterium haemolyticum]|nr:hypothetical protein [Arcanobacterium haemolyticum]
MAWRNREEHANEFPRRFWSTSRLFVATKKDDDIRRFVDFDDESLPNCRDDEPGTFVVAKNETATHGRKNAPKNVAGE